MTEKTIDARREVLERLYDSAMEDGGGFCADNYITIDQALAKLDEIENRKWDVEKVEDILAVHSLGVLGKGTVTRSQAKAIIDYARGMG